MSSSNMAQEEREVDNSIDCCDSGSIVGRNVVVTGFGLFRDHQVNPSWEAIKDIGQLKIDRPNLNIITKQIDVAYREVDNVVPALWKEYNPILMVHIGLAASDSRIRIEQVARHGPYIHDDVLKEAPDRDFRDYGNDGEEMMMMEENVLQRKYSCKPHKFGCSRTGLNVDRVCDKLNKAFKEDRIKLESGTSSDAGLYVCEYIYHKSLSICDRCVFIHVPDISENCKLEDIRLALKLAIEALVDEVMFSCKGS